MSCARDINILIENEPSRDFGHCNNLRESDHVIRVKQRTLEYIKTYFELIRIRDFSRKYDNIE